MKLARVHVREFKSIRDSNQFGVGNVTCLVGKNEAGKTAILEALYRLNPVVPQHAKFDVTEDYPRIVLPDNSPRHFKAYNGQAGGSSMGTAMPRLKEEPHFYVVQTQGSFRNEIGEMTETALYGHLGTRLGSEAVAAAVLRELQEKGIAIARFTDSMGLENTI